jgi:hypothetical protein
MIYSLFGSVLVLLLIYMVTPKEFSAYANQPKPGSVGVRRRIFGGPILDANGRVVDIRGKLVGYANGRSMEPKIKHGGLFVASRLSDASKALLSPGDIVVTVDSVRTSQRLRTVKSVRDLQMVSFEDGDADQHFAEVTAKIDWAQESGK